MTERVAFVRPEALQLEPAVHGSVALAELAELGLSLGDTLDFSVNTNPLGPAPSVLQAVRSTDWSRYPGDDEAPLRASLAERSNVRPEQVAIGNGSAELIWLIALAAFRTGDRVGITGPTFGEYARAVRVVGATPIEVGDPHGASGVRATSRVPRRSSISRRRCHAVRCGTPSSRAAPTSEPCRAIASSRPTRQSDTATSPSCPSSQIFSLGCTRRKCGLPGTTDTDFHVQAGWRRR